MMLEVTRRLRLTTIVAAAAMTLTVAMFAGLASAGSAFADHAWGSGHGWGREAPVTLNGEWAPMNLCPVDNPAMLAANGTTTVALCLADNSPNGSLTIGNLTVTTKDNNHQFGVILNRETGTVTAVEPTPSGLVDEPVEVPGGLQGLICPSHERFARHICRHLHGWGWDHDANTVTLTMESAGDVSNVVLIARPGQPLASQPIKIHLQNKLLGNNCYIGSDAEPIVFQPEALTPPTLFELSLFDGNGTLDPENGPLAQLHIDNTQGASSFAVPAASGCGFRGFFNQAINGKLGLPSPAGKNSIVFNEAANYLVVLNFPENSAPNAGAVLSKYWHSAVVPPEEGSGHHRHDHDGDHHDGDHRHWSGREGEEEFRHWFSHGH